MGAGKPSFTGFMATAAAMLMAMLVCGLGAPAQAATGYWRYSSYAVLPPQAQLDAAQPGPGRVLEQKLHGAFQPAESGAGTLDLSFKADDIDHRIFLTTVRFSFTTGVEMRSLTPGQTLKFRGVLSVGGNDLAKALPASGSGRMAVDNADYFLSTESPIDRGASGEGSFVVPSGSPGTTMRIYVQGYVSSAGGLSGRLEIYYQWVQGAAPNPTPQPQPQPEPRPHPQPGPDAHHGHAGDRLGDRLKVQELDGLWRGVWTRRPGTDVFDAVWHRDQYPEVRDVIRLESLSGDQVVFTRDGNGGRYYGRFSPDGRTISGTASWYSPGMSWSAQVDRR